jgi:hypothetical protein
MPHWPPAIHRPGPDRDLDVPTFSVRHNHRQETGGLRGVASRFTGCPTKVLEAVVAAQQELDAIRAGYADTADVSIAIVLQKGVQVAGRWRSARNDVP